jgi:hypothetical protein
MATTRVRLHGHKRKNVAEQEVEKSNMKEPMAMARLAWIASELGSAIRLSEGTHHTAEASTDENPERWRDAAYSIRHTPLRYSLLTASVYPTGQLPYCWQAGSNEPVGWPRTRRLPTV